jgi:hypothetical protein
MIFYPQLEKLNMLMLSSSGKNQHKIEKCESKSDKHMLILIW